MEHLMTQKALLILHILGLFSPSYLTILFTLGFAPFTHSALLFSLLSRTPGSRQASPTEVVERLGPSTNPPEGLGPLPNPTANKPLVEEVGLDSLQFDYPGNQVPMDSSGATVGLFDYNSQQQVKRLL